MTKVSPKGTTANITSAQACSMSSQHCPQYMNVLIFVGGDFTIALHGSLDGGLQVQTIIHLLIWYYSCKCSI